MPTRDRSICGISLAAARIHAMRSGKPASAMFFQHTSWNAFERCDVPMPSICTTMNPSSATACAPWYARNALGTCAEWGPA